MLITTSNASWASWLGPVTFLTHFRYGITDLVLNQTHDIFPILETKNLARFRISFLRSTTWDDNCLIEYYTLVFRYPPDGKCGIDIWRAGIGEQHISDTNFKLWNLGDYLNRLPSLNGK